MVDSFNVSLIASFIRKKKLMKLALSETLKLSTIPVLPIMSMLLDNERYSKTSPKRPPPGANIRGLCRRVVAIRSVLSVRTRLFVHENAVLESGWSLFMVVALARFY